MTSVPVASLWAEPQDWSCPGASATAMGCHAAVSLRQHVQQLVWVLIPVGELVEGPLLPAPLLLSCWLLGESCLVLKSVGIKRESLRSQLHSLEYTLRGRWPEVGL